MNLLWLSLLNRRVAAAAVDVVYGRNDGLALVLLAMGVDRADRAVGTARTAARGHAGIRARPDVTRRSTATAPRSEFWFESFIRRPVANALHRRRQPVATRRAPACATGLGRMSWLMAAGLAASLLIVPLLSGGNAARGGARWNRSCVVTAMLPPPARVRALVAGGGRRWATSRSAPPRAKRSSARSGWRSRWIWQRRGRSSRSPPSCRCCVPRADWPDLLFGGFLALSAAMAVVVFAMNVWVLRLAASAERDRGAH